MTFARVVPDIPSRAIEGSFDYAIPENMKGEVQVGCTVLISFSRRLAVGYVVEIVSEPPEGVDPERILPIEQVLVEPAFDETSARVAAWMSREYAAPLSECIRMFLPPGQTVKVNKNPETDAWELSCESAGPLDARWVSLTEEGASFEPRKDASRQRSLLAALSAGPVRMAELSAMASGMGQVVSALEKRGIVAVETRRLVRGSDDTSLSSATAAKPAELTQGQAAALEAIRSACAQGEGGVVVVDGVTGSGKTEVYLSAIEDVLRAGKGAIVLVPEISLTPQTVGRFRSRFGDDVAILHSRLSTGERFDQWDMVRRGRAHVVVGARSALFAPLFDVGLIVVDEEHENSYKQGSSPRYHARELAARIASERGCALVLGSATPSLESLYRCRLGSWRGVPWIRVEMLERPGTSLLPEIEIVDMTNQFREGNRTIFSDPLRKALLEIRSRREKAVLLLNRRGFANFLMCRECGCVPTCSHCSTSLTLHERTHSLDCHTCGRSWPLGAWRGKATTCPNCGSPYLAAFGLGTQRVEDELQLLLGEDVDIIRMDADTTKTKGAHQRLLEEFDASECAVLIGTQMIAKGLDFPEVTLVGVVNADTTLKMPDFRAAERTYDLLEQVAGRAGRGERPGRVVVQTYWAAHPAIRAVARHDRGLFLEAELEEREEAFYPPFSRLANIVCWGKRVQDVEAQVQEMAQELRALAEDHPGWQILGPAECLKSKVKDAHRRHILIKTPPTEELGEVLLSCASGIRERRGVRMALDVDAYDLM